jgi:hypothetical protein
LFGKNTPRLSDQAKKLFKKKGTIEYIWKIIVSSGYSVPNKIPIFFHIMYLKNCLVHKWQGNTTSSYISSMKKGKKKKFIPLSWKIGYFIFRNINKIDEFASHFDNVSLKYAGKIKGFNPNKIFFEYMLSVGFNNFFIQTTLNEEEEGNNQSTLVHEAGDLEKILSTNELYKKKGKGHSERSAQSLVFTPKITTSQSNALTNHPVRNIANISSSG